MFRLTALWLIIRRTPPNAPIDDNVVKTIMKPILSDYFSAFATVAEVKKRASRENACRKPNISPGLQTGTVILNGRTFSKLLIVTAYHNLLDAAESLMGDLLLGLDPKIDCERIFDNPHESRQILPSTDPTVVNEFEEFLINAVTSPPLQETWCIWRKGKFGLRERKCKEYLEKFYLFVELLLNLVHIGGGMPARATELTPYRLRSTGNDDRSVFWYGNHVYIFSKYNKSSSITGRNRPIARFLDPRLSQLLLKDIFFVRPFAASLAADAAADDDDDDNRLGSIIRTEMLGLGLPRSSTEELCVRALEHE
jgi:hypothetical protein